MKKILFFTLFIPIISVFSQKTINSYKYVIIPKQLEIVNKPDKYQTSSLTKFLFNKYGFIAFLSDDELPEDLARNRCLALTANVKDNSGMFSTKNRIELTNCNNQVLYTSNEGVSKNKDYKKAYHQAIRNAFESIRKLNYKYVLATKENVGIKKETSAVVPIPNEIENKQVVVNKPKNILYAQPITNGFQLVNTKPEVVFQVLKTNLKDVFVIKGKNGLLYKSGTNWIAEYNIDHIKKIEIYQIKF